VNLTGKPGRTESPPGMPENIFESILTSVAANPLLAPAHPVRVGCAGWNIPRQAIAEFAPARNHLERYSRVFDCCEINSSFYRPHKKETWERWAHSVPPGFQFSVKAPRTITHEAKLNCNPGMLSVFLEQIKHMRDKLGPILFQLPPSFGFDHARAREFLSLLRTNYSGDVVWEARHASWFDVQADDLLGEFQIARVAADTACVPAARQPGGLANLAYFRLHGSPRRYFSSYSGDFLNTLAAQLAILGERARVWCVFDNTGSGAAIQNALELARKLGRVAGNTMVETH